MLRPPPSSMLCPYTTFCCFFFFNNTAPTEISPLSLHDALPIKTYWPPADPAAGAIDTHADVGDETKGQRNQSECEPEAPRPLPEMVIGERGRTTKHQANAEPDGLAPNKKIDVAMFVLGESARAKKHHDADDEHRQHGQEQNVGALTMHP